MLRPNLQPLLDARLVWLTDLAVPERWGLGLTSTFIPCDRTECRYRALTHVGIVPWITSAYRAALPPETLDDLECFGQPLRWYVSALPIAVERA